MGLSFPEEYRMVRPTHLASYASVSKYDRPQPTLEEGPWALSGEWTKMHFKPSLDGSGMASQEDVLAEMDLTTSCGYPWNITYHNKKEFLNDPAMKQVLEDYWEAVSGPDPRPTPIWTCSQKVELRPKSKLEFVNDLGQQIPKHRTFTASPIENTTAINRACLVFNNKFYRARDTWSFVGVTKFLQGWHNLFVRLHKHPNAMELDEKDYDASLFIRALEGQRDLRWSFYPPEEQTPENKRKLWFLYETIIHSVVVLEDGELFQKHGGNPSGSPNTIVDNTMILFRLLAYAWIIAHKRRYAGVANAPAVSYSEFMENVEAALCGDDNTATVSDDWWPYFNPTIIIDIWKGVGVTAETPSTESMDLKDVHFLSNGFAFDKNLYLWMPRPEMDRVLGSLAYGSPVDDPRWHYLRACALRLDSYGNVECRKILSDYIRYLDQNYKDELVGSVERGGVIIPMKDIRASWHSDVWIESLYSGLESQGSALKESSLFKFLSSTASYQESDSPPLFSFLQSVPSTPLFQISEMPPKASKIDAAEAQRRLKQAARDRAAAKVGKSVAKKVITGRGDYRPTSMSRKISGRGDYFSDLLGGAGHALGNLAGGAIGKLFGSGDYHKDGPSSNSIWKHRGASSAVKDTLSRAGSDPSMAPFSMGAMSVQFDEGPPRVTHREFIGPILAPGDTKFHTKAYRIQPGLKGTDVLFPWGSSVAACFQQYELMGMVLEYRTTSSNFAAESALGTVMLSTLYDANASPLATQQAVDNNDFTTATVPSASVYHPIECATKESPTTVRYVRTSNSATGEGDERLDDVGVFQVSMTGITAAAGAQLGELWATYDIKFMKASLPDLHAGTTFVASGIKTSLLEFNTSLFKDWNANMGSSLPVVLYDGLGKLDMPIGYNGAFLFMFTTSATSDGTNFDLFSWAANAFTHGTDITLISLLPHGNEIEQIPYANSYGYSTPAPTVGNPTSQTFVALFSTIAENSDQNWIQISPYWNPNPGAPFACASSMIISAMDSDLITAQASLERELARLTRNPTILKILLESQRPKGSRARRNSIDQEYVYGTGEMTPIPSGQQSAAAAAAARQMMSPTASGGALNRLRGA